MAKQSSIGFTVNRYKDRDTHYEHCEVDLKRVGSLDSILRITWQRDATNTTERFYACHVIMDQDCSNALADAMQIARKIGEYHFDTTPNEMIGKLESLGIRQMVYDNRLSVWDSRVFLPDVQPAEYSAWADSLYSTRRMVSILARDEQEAKRLIRMELAKLPDNEHLTEYMSRHEPVELVTCDKVDRRPWREIVFVAEPEEVTV